MYVISANIIKGNTVVKNFASMTVVKFEALRK